MPTYKTPGIYFEEKSPASGAVLRTGVPAFLALAGEVYQKSSDPVIQLGLWPEFLQNFTPDDESIPLESTTLGQAVHGFFANGGERCLVCLAPRDQDAMASRALERVLEMLAADDDLHLLCAPDLFRLTGSVEEQLQLQTTVLEHCDAMGDRFAILDSLPGASPGDVANQRQKLRGTNGALYYPWIRTLGGSAPIPPCGHVAGIYARSDRLIGVHKAPANEVLEDTADLEFGVTGAQQAMLNPMGVNCLRAFPGRGRLVWGARTLSDDPAWTYVNVRRLFLTAGRWIRLNMSNNLFEPNDPRLWARIVRDLTVYFTELFRGGALKGSSVAEVFYIKCDAETNPPGEQDQGRVIAEIGLAPTVPSEFVVVRIVHDVSGVTITGPS